MKNLQQMLRVFVMVLLSLAMASVNAFADDDGGYLYDESAYTKQVEASMNEMHTLYLKAFDTNISKHEADKIKKEYYKISQGLIRDMHQRVMSLNVKAGAALSHTDILLSTHMSLMLLDMLAAEQLSD